MSDQGPRYKVGSELKFNERWKARDVQMAGGR